MIKKKQIDNQLPTWDLSSLYNSAEDPQIHEDLNQVKAKVDEFVSKYKGNIAQVEDQNLLLAAIKDYEEISQDFGKLGSFAFLNYATQLNDPKAIALFSEINEKMTNYSNPMLFFTLELNQISEETLTDLLKNDELNKYDNWLQKLRNFKPYQLSEAEENILQQKDLTSNDAWVRLFDETMSALRFEVDGVELNESEVLKLFSDSDEKVREKAAHAFAKVMEKNSALFTLITNTLAKDKAVNDSIRGVEHVMKMRNLSNDIEDEVVDSLIASVKQHYESIAHRYYAIKAKLMGKESLNYWDRNAPLEQKEQKLYTWQEAKEIILAAYTEFSPEMAEIAERFFDENWIDAPVVDGKRSGAFAHPTVPSAHPYVLVNFQGKVRDVATLAHELGHGVHQVLAAEQGPILSSTPLTLAETASVFAEQLTFRKILEDLPEEEKKLLICNKIEDMLNTVFRQIAFCDFELQVHEARKEKELSSQEIAEIWLQTQKNVLGPIFNLSDEYGVYWSYVPHFIHSPFYVYSYAFGDCLVNSLYKKYEKTENKEQFAKDYLNMLAQGGSKHYTELLEGFDLNPHDPEFWDMGMNMIEEFIDMIE